MFYCSQITLLCSIHSSGLVFIKLDVCLAKMIRDFREKSYLTVKLVESKSGRLWTHRASKFNSSSNLQSCCLERRTCWLLLLLFSKKESERHLMFRSALRGATLRRPTVPPLTRKSNNPSDRALFSRIAFTGNIGIEPAVAVNDRTGRESIRYVVASPYGPRENRRTSWFRVTSFATGPTREYLLGIAKGWVCEEVL